MRAPQQVFRPTCIPNLKLWLETDTASYPTAVVFPSDVVTNGGFEAGDPPTGWTIVRGTISRQAGVRTGGSGSYVCRIAHDGTNTSGVIYQAALVVGNTYRMTGYARASAAGGVPAMADGVTFQWTGTTSTSWQAFDVTFVSTGTTCSLYGSSLSAGKYVEFDDVAIMPIHVSQLTDLSGNGNHLTQATASKQPLWVASGIGGYASFDGAADFLQKSFTLAQPWHLFVCAAWTKKGTATYLADGVGGSSLGILGHDGTNPTAYIAAPTSLTGASFTTAQWSVFDAEFNGASSYVAVNGSIPSLGNAGANNAGGLTLGASAAGTVPAQSLISSVVVVSGAMNEATRQRVIQYMRRKAAMLGVPVA